MHKKLQFFSEIEAWNLFRFAAFGEAIGWTLLITGIVYKHLQLRNSEQVLTVLGQTHGTLFVGYLFIVLAVSASLGFSRLQFILATAMSVPPYGTLVYEKWLSHWREYAAGKLKKRVFVYGIITDGKYIMVVQPAQSFEWQLPGGQVLQNESSKSTLRRNLFEKFCVQATLGSLAWAHDNISTIELYFTISNSADFMKIDVSQKALKSAFIDECEMKLISKLPIMNQNFITKSAIRRVSASMEQGNLETKFYAD